MLLTEINIVLNWHPRCLSYPLKVGKLLEDTLQLAEDIGLDVTGFVCDRGTVNTGVVKKFLNGIFNRTRRDGSIHQKLPQKL
uniref:Uncharacterized protein n=1 Tax=Glossina palpalis gambiensis TaxID=67801 RepID=A0A1B0BZA4_9MUSC